MTFLVYSIPSILLASFSIYAYVQSRRELQYHAAKRFLILGLLSAVLCLSFNLLTEKHLLVFSLLFFAFGFFLFIFFAGNFRLRKLSFNFDFEAKGRIDERDTMFSRNELKEGSPNYEHYYEMRPENKEKDQKFRCNPGLACEGTYFYHKEIFDASNETFKLVDNLHPFVDGKVSKEKHSYSIDPSIFYKRLAKDLGAYTVGITSLKPEHYYSVGGRKERYGNNYVQEHTHAIAFTVEMSHFMMMFAPKAPTLLESANQYLQSGRIAVTLAMHLRSMGYEARAHMDGNYKLVAPLVARDAGLGEIGRMGLLMTPELGPRVRLAVVTTNLKLDPTPVQNDLSVIDFCARCKKCAHNCPSQAISFDPPSEINGVYRWKINQEACFEYWTKSGTDCGRCVIVCPYSHPNNFLHNIVRKGIHNSGTFRRFALAADDYIYGKHPKIIDLQHYFDNKTN